jgi:hypothetical protein
MKDTLCLFTYPRRTRSLEGHLASKDGTLAGRGRRKGRVPTLTPNTVVTVVMLPTHR